MEQATDKNIFIAYSRKDIDFLNELRVFLRPLEQHKGVKIWYDGEIAPGEVWEDSIKKALHQADIILLLVSANSLASDYFYGREVAEAMERHRQHTCTVIPVILRPCGWEETELATLQVLPKDGEAVTLWENRDAAYKSIFDGIKAVISKAPAQEVKPTPPAPATPKPVEKRKKDPTTKNTAPIPAPQTPTERDSGTLKAIIGGVILVLGVAVWYIFIRPADPDPAKPGPNIVVTNPSGIIMNTIVPGQGFGQVQLGKTSLKSLEKQFGTTYSNVTHNTYSEEVQFSKAGISFYFPYQEYHAIKTAEMKYFTSISLYPPFKGKTDKGIMLEYSTMEEVEKAYGKADWTTTPSGDYWTKSYPRAGIRFSVLKDKTKPAYPIDDALHIKKQIVNIELFSPLTPIIPR